MTSFAKWTWKEAKVGFEIRAITDRKPSLDISIVETGNNVKLCVLLLRLPATGDIRNGSIVRIDGGSMEVFSAVTTERVVA